MIEGMTLADSSIIIESIRPSGCANAVKRVRDLATADRLAVWDVVVGEVLIGARTERAYQKIYDLLLGFESLATPDDVWQRAARVGFDLRRKGVTVPLTDLAIAVVAIEHEVPLVHMDKHFELIAQVCDLDHEYVSPTDED